MASDTRRGLIERINACLAMNRLDHVVSVPRDLLFACRDAVAACVVNHPESWAVAPAAREPTTETSDG